MVVGIMRRAGKGRVFTELDGVGPSEIGGSRACVRDDFFISHALKK